MTGTKFTKKNLIKTGGGFVEYRPTGWACQPDNRFVARFRRGMGGPAGFMTHLRKNWTVEAYFAEVDAGSAPLEIVRKTGFITNNMKRFLKSKGYAPNIGGYNNWRNRHDSAA